MPQTDLLDTKRVQECTCVLFVCLDTDSDARIGSASSFFAGAPAFILHACQKVRVPLATVAASQSIRNLYKLTKRLRTWAAAGRLSAEGTLSKCSIVWMIPAAQRSVALHTAVHVGQCIEHCTTMFLLAAILPARSIWPCRPDGRHKRLAPVAAVCNSSPLLLACVRNTLCDITHSSLHWH